MRLQASRLGTGPRAGFTMVELIVVVSIITVLAALVASAVMRFAGTQQEENTKTLIAKTYGQLIRQWRSAIELARQEAGPNSLNNLPAGLFKLAGKDDGFADWQDRARVLWVKLRLRQLFPMSYAEIVSGPNFGGTYSGLDAALQPPDSYRKSLNSYTGSSHDPGTEGGACLLIALTARATKGKELNAEDFSNLEVKDTDGDGVNELVDGWGRPLRFYRWPTGNSEVDHLNPGDLGATTATQMRFRDPQDPTGLLIQWDGTTNGWWWPSPNTYRPDFEQVCHSLTDPTNSSLPKSFYTVPVIVSAGADGKFGIKPVSAGAPNPMAPVTDQSDPEYGADKDNIWSFRIVTR